MSHTHTADAAHDAHGDHHHGEATYPYTPHHFYEAKQHFESGKLGVWLFLVTEILFFAGLFCAYTVYRAQHPEVFYWAHFFLDTKLGALNTAVLIFSSFTAAWSVRNAQLGQTKLLKANIIITILCAFTFMGVKYVEYSHKFHDGLLPARHFAPTHEVWETETFAHKHPGAAAAAERIVAGLAVRSGKPAPVAHGHHGEAKKTPVFVDDPKLAKLPNDQWLDLQIKKLSPEERKPLEMAGVIKRLPGAPLAFGRPDHAGVFFSIYFFMTGLHGVHVVIGIGIWIWMLAIASKRRFGPQYFGPVEFSALYWHLVDLVWIYLFPLLYLIH